MLARWSEPSPPRGRRQIPASALSLGWRSHLSCRTKRLGPELRPGAMAPGPCAATTVRLAFEYALTIERPAMVEPKAPSPTPEIFGIAGAPGALATCPAKTVAPWCAKIATGSNSGGTGVPTNDPATPRPGHSYRATVGASKRSIGLSQRRAGCRARRCRRCGRRAAWWRGGR